MRFRMVLLDSLFGLRKEFTMVALPSPVDQQPLHRFSIHGYLKLTKTLGSCWNQLPIFIRHKLQRFMLFKMPDWISDNCMALGAPNKGMNSVQKQIRTLKFFQWLNLILFSKEHEICHLIYLLFNRSGEESEKKLKKKKNFFCCFFQMVLWWNETFQVQQQSFSVQFPEGNASSSNASSMKLKVHISLSRNNNQKGCPIEKKESMIWLVLIWFIWFHLEFKIENGRIQLQYFE